MEQINGNSWNGANSFWGKKSIDFKGSLGAHKDYDRTQLVSLALPTFLLLTTSDSKSTPSKLTAQPRPGKSRRSPGWWTAWSFIASLEPKLVCMSTGLLLRGAQFILFSMSLLVVPIPRILILAPVSSLSHRNSATSFSYYHFPTISLWILGMMLTERLGSGEEVGLEAKWVAVYAQD